MEKASTVLQVLALLSYNVSLCCIQKQHSSCSGGVFKLTFTNILVLLFWRMNSGVMKKVLLPFKRFFVKKEKSYIFYKQDSDFSIVNTGFEIAIILLMIPQV